MGMESVVDLAFSVLSRRPAGLLADIDGTLSEIAPTPGDARVTDDVRDSVRRLTRHIDLVGVISGRGVEDARSIVGIDDLVYSGNHGMERWFRGEYTMENEAAQYIEAIARLTDAVAAEIKLPGVLVENKQLTASIHYRNAPQPERAESVILREVYALSSELGLRVTRGRMVVEVRPPVDRDKGSSVMAIVDDFNLRGAIYVGDDTTDVDAFRALRTWRESTGNRSLAIGVSGPETPVAVIDASDVTVEGVRGVKAVLDALHRRLSEQSTG
jgi:trehalose 6-phosphate phosphatase